jgi:hypothetical protein
VDISKRETTCLSCLGLVFLRFLSKRRGLAWDRFAVPGVKTGAYAFPPFFWGDGGYYRVKSLWRSKNRVWRRYLLYGQ